MEQEKRSKRIARLTLSKIVKYFFRGVLITLPAAATFWIIKWLVDKFDELFGFTNMGLHGLGIIIILTAITFIGYLGSIIVLKPILDIIDDLLEKVPGIKVIYTTIKDFLEAFVGENRKFKEPVMVEMTSNGVMKMGFVTHKDLSKIAVDGYVAVYFPHSYNFSGNLFLVPADKVKPIDGNSSEIMKFIVTGGVTEL